ncbi:RING finger protein 207-like [Oscarella lobularis]|uniref:RING finger protein 207-like n=1 Tax=Oscarella lobularis TaxID=121494 RepID=UPI00331397BA
MSGLPLAGLTSGSSASLDTSLFSCPVCANAFTEPKLLACLHSVCTQCVTQKGEEPFKCPMCCDIYADSESDSFQAQDDRLLDRLKTAMTPPLAECVNCDAKIARVEAIFCHTCDQVLCESCRKLVHASKMFASHKIGPITRETENERICKMHEKPLIMFLAESSRLLCVKCFNELESENKALCIDLDVAYEVKRSELNEKVVACQSLAKAVAEGVEKARNLLEDARASATREKGDVEALHASLLDTLASKRASLFEEIERLKAKSQQNLSRHLQDLQAFLPTIEFNLALCEKASQEFDKYSFLELFDSATERLSRLVNWPHHVPDEKESQIVVNMRDEYACCLHPLLEEEFSLCLPSFSTFTTFSFSPPTRNYGEEKQLSSSNGAPGSTGKRLSFSAGAVANGNSPFAEHCKTFNPRLKKLQTKITSLKEEVQDVHRDLTKRKCHPTKNDVTDIVAKCKSIDVALASQKEVLEKRRNSFERAWNDTLSRVALEQEIYQAQVHEVNKLQQDNLRLATITESIQPFLKSLVAASERNDPRLNQAAVTRAQERQLKSLFHQIDEIHPNTKQRIRAIEGIKRKPDAKSATKSADSFDGIAKARGLLKTAHGQRSKADPKQS